MALRTSKRSSALGLSGMRAGHLQVLLQDEDGLELLAYAGTCLARFLPKNGQTCSTLLRARSNMRCRHVAQTFWFPCFALNLTGSLARLSCQRSSPSALLWELGM